MTGARQIDRFPLEIVIVASMAFVVYIVTLQPSVPGGDSGELIGVACSGGVAHPPGYPLYSMLAWLFAKLPMGSVAWRVNLFSAVCNALAAGLLAALVVRWTGRRDAGLAAGFLFAFSPLVWSYSTVAEVFALNNLIVVGMLAVTLRFTDSRDPRWAYAGACLIGLGFANHHTITFFVLPLAVWSLFGFRETLLRPRRLLLLAAALALGLSPYLYLPLAALGDSPIAWGDPSSLTGFIDHLLRREYGTLRLGGEIPAGRFFLDQLVLYGKSLAANTLYVGPVLALIGLRRSLAGSPRRGLGRALLACWLFYIVVFHFAANLPINEPLFREVTARFWMQPNIVVFLWIGLGWSALVRIEKFGPYLAGILLLVQLGLQFPMQNQRGNRHVERYGRAILEPLPARSILLTKGDLVTNSVRYLQTCEQLRPDVIVLDQELLTKTWYVARVSALWPDLTFPAARYHPREPDGFSMRQFLDVNSAIRSVYVYPELKQGDSSVTGAYEPWPRGLASRLVANDDRPPLVAWRDDGAEALRQLERLAWPDPERYPAGSWEYIVLSDLWEAWNRRVVWLLGPGSGGEFDFEILDECRELLERSLEGHPDPPPHLLKNLGVTLDRLRLRDPSLIERRDAVWREYLRVGPRSDPQRPAIEAAIGPPAGVADAVERKW